MFLLFSISIVNVEFSRASFFVYPRNFRFLFDCHHQFSFISYSHRCPYVLSVLCKVFVDRISSLSLQIYASSMRSAFIAKPLIGLYIMRFHLFLCKSSYRVLLSLVYKRHLSIFICTIGIFYQISVVCYYNTRMFAPAQCYRLHDTDHILFSLVS